MIRFVLSKSIHSLVILLDPTPTEESLALSTHVFAFSFSGRIAGSSSNVSETSFKSKKRRRVGEDMDMVIDREGEDDELEEENDQGGRGEKVEMIYNDSYGRFDLELVSSISVNYWSSRLSFYGRRYREVETLRLEIVWSFFLLRFD